MALEYVTTLTVLDAASRAPAGLTDVASVVCEWAGIEGDSMRDGEFSGRDEASVTTQLLDPGDPDRWAWRLTMDVTNQDRSGEPVAWTALVTVVEGVATRVTIRVERRARTERLRPLQSRPKPPRIVKQLLASQQFVAMDGCVPVVPEVIRPSRDRIDEFVDSVLLHESRRLPVLAFSKSHDQIRSLPDADRVADELVGLAHVCLLSSDTTWKLSERLGARLSVYNGAVRLWWPGLQGTDSPYSHPLWLPRAGAQTIEHEIVRTIVDTARTHFSEPQDVLALERELQRQQDDELRVELERLRELAARPSGTEPDSADAAVGLEESIRSRIVKIEADRETALMDLVVSEEERDELTRKVAELQSEVYRLRARSGYWEQDDLDSGDMSPEAAFCEEVREEYLSRFTQADHVKYPLASMKLGRAFLASMEQTDIRREKVVQVCAEIACRRAQEMPGREVHQLRVSKAPGAAQRQRASDGALAWRCYLENRTSQAARLHWWSTRDTIEFAAVGPHDHFDIPE